MMIDMHHFFQVLASFTRHYKTGEPLPEHIITELCHAKKMYSASVGVCLYKFVITLCIYVIVILK